MGGVSVVIPVYGKELKLVKALKSLQHQSYKDEIDTVIVWDEPKNIKYYEKFIKKIMMDSNININVIYNPKKTNPAKARNTGLEYSTYDIIFFLDSDDYFGERKIELQAEIMKNSKIGLCYTDVLMVDETGNVLKKIIAPDEAQIRVTDKTFLTNIFVPNAWDENLKKK